MPNISTCTSLDGGRASGGPQREMSTRSVAVFDPLAGMTAALQSTVIHPQGSRNPVTSIARSQGFVISIGTDLYVGELWKVTTPRSAWAGERVGVAEPAMLTARSSAYTKSAGDLSCAQNSVS